MECYDWSAWYNRMPGAEDPNLYVSGRCRLDSGSDVITLTPGNEGIINDPDVFVLDLRVERKKFGDTQAPEREVSWNGNAGPDIKRVHIRTAGAETTSVDVTEAV